MVWSVLRRIFEPIFEVQSQHYMMLLDKAKEIFCFRTIGSIHLMIWYLFRNITLKTFFVEWMSAGVKFEFIQVFDFMKTKIAIFVWTRSNYSPICRSISWIAWFSSFCWSRKVWGGCCDLACWNSRKDICLLSVWKDSEFR